MTDARSYHHRFPMIIRHAVWLSHRFPLSDRDVQELFHQRGIEISHEILREWCIKFGSLFAEACAAGHPGRVPTSVDGVRHWLWMAVDEHGFVLDILVQRHRDTRAAKTFLIQLRGEYDVSGVIHTDQFRSSGPRFESSRAWLTSTTSG